MLAASVLLVGSTSPGRRAAQLTTRAALAGIHVYQATLSPLYARTGVQCRFKITLQSLWGSGGPRLRRGEGRMAGVQARAALRPVDADGNGRPATDPPRVGRFLPLPFAFCLEP